jgi:hypothetical protein
MWLGWTRPGLRFLRLYGLFSVTLTNPQFISKPQRRRNFI